jgi:hypothetical protein
MFTHNRRFIIVVLIVALVLGFTVFNVMAQGGEDTSPE